MKRMAVMLLAVLQVTYTLAGDYTYTSAPAKGNYTNSGYSGTTTEGLTIDYYNETLAGGTTDYANGLLKVAYMDDNGSGRFTFRFAKESGYFVNGNKGKVFVFDSYDGSVFGYSFRITNSTTSYFDATFGIGNFSGTHFFDFYLITSDQLYFQYGGKMGFKGEVQMEAPSVITKEPIDVKATSATLYGIVNTNGGDTEWYFKYGLNNNLNRSTTPVTSEANKGAHYVSTEVTGLIPGNKYSVKLVAKNEAGQNTGDKIQFKTTASSNNPLEKPTNPSPANGATGVPTSGTFSWECNNPGVDVQYKVSIGTSANNIKTSYPITEETHIQYSGLENDKDYWWQVEVSDGTQVVKNDQPWQFRTRSGSTPIDYDCEFPDEDLKPGKSAFYEPTCYLYKRDVINGSDIDGMMDAEGPLIRAHLAKIAFRGVYSVNGRSVPRSVPSDNYPTIYEDLKKGSYYYQAARALFYLEYGDGVAPFDRNRTKFEPDSVITRLHTLKVLMETFNIEPDLVHSNNPFPDDDDVVELAENNPRMMGYLRRAEDLGIVTEGRPQDNCLRGEAFTILARIMQKVEDGTINDPNPNTADYFEPLSTTLETISLGAGLPLGNFNHYAKTSFALDGVVPLVLSHSYNSYNTTLPEVFFAVNDNGETYQPLGDGWSHNYHTYMTALGDIGTSDARYIVHWGGGSIDVYRSQGSKIVPISYGVYDDFSIVDHEIVITSKSQVEYHFASLGSSAGASIIYLVSIKDRNDNTLTLNYESGEKGYKRIKSVSDGHRSLRFSYKPGTNLLAQVSDPLGRTVEYDYKFNDQTQRYQLSSFTDAKGQTTTYLYGESSKISTSKLLTKIQLPKGNYIKNEYDLYHRLSHTERGVDNVPTTEIDVEVRTDYGGSNTTVSTVDVTRSGSRKSSYNYIFNSNNVMTNMTGKRGLFVEASYNDESTQPHLPESIRSNKTNVSDITYDDMGNVESITITGDGTLTTSMTYDDMNNLETITDPMKHTTTFTYDSRGNLIEISAPEGVTTSITVNSKGLPISITDPMGVETQIDYNSYGNVIQTTLTALELTNRATYDNASRLTRVTDALDRIHRFEYDDNDNLLSSTNPMSHTITYDYDENDNVTRITNEKGGATTLVYDDATDWLESVSFAGATKRYEYNKDGTLASYTKPDGTSFEYDYDDLGRVIDDGVNRYSYDSKMRLSTISDDERTLSFSYDGFNRITGTSCDGHDNTYTYDKNSNCTSVNNTTYEYDQLNRMTSVNFGNKTISYYYRMDSQLSKVVYPNGMTTTYG